MVTKKIHTPWWLSGGIGLLFGGWLQISALEKRHTLQEIFTTSLIWEVIGVAAFTTAAFIVVHERLDRKTNDLRSKSK